MLSAQPQKLKSVFKDYIWGGEKLKNFYNKETDLSVVAESWELSAHPDGESVISEGEHKGQSLTEYIKKTGRSVLGANAEKFGYFPILIKLIDAKRNLSVQVHPDDSYALKNEDEYGKTEMWYVLESDDDAFIYYGFSRDVTETELKKAIEDNTVCELLNKVKTKKGDVFFIPSGTVHAIGAGNLICEVQQNSNVTYRMYDYGRVDKDGKTRELHIDKAVEVSNLQKMSELRDMPEGEDTILASCEYFTARKISVLSEKNIKINEKSFHSLIVADGEGTIKLDTFEINIQKGDSIFIPAQNGEYNIYGHCDVVLSYV